MTRVADQLSRDQSSQGISRDKSLINVFEMHHSLEKKPKIILQQMHRPHSLSDSRTKILRYYYMKICIHMGPGEDPTKILTLGFLSI